MAVVDIFVFAAGFAAAWYGKDFILSKISGAEAFAAKLETKAAAIKAKIKK